MLLYILYREKQLSTVNTDDVETKRL